MTATRSFEELLDEGGSVPLEGWDFSWFEGRATEQRPSWGYARLLAARLATATAALDIQTGGGEVLAWALGHAGSTPRSLAATEGWPPNVDVARRNLPPLGVTVVEAAEDAGLPFPANSFDLVSSRHPNVVVWPEIGRVLRPGGTYLAQHIGTGTVRELTDFMMGPQPVNDRRSPGRAVAEAEAVGLTVVDLRQEALRMEFYDVAAVVHFLRKVIWIVPGFTVARYRDRLAEMHDRIQNEGPFVAYSQRILIEAYKPDR